MRDLKWYANEIATTVAATESIFATAGDNDLTDEQVASVQANRERVERLRTEERALAETYAAAKPVLGSPFEQPGRPSAGGIFSVRDLAEDKPWGHDSGHPLGEQLMAIAAADSPHGHVDPRLRRAGGMFAAASGASVAVPSEGGYLMGTAQSDALLARAAEESPILGMCRSIPIPPGFDSIDLPVIDETSRATGSRWGGVQVYRKSEAATVTATKPAFGQLKLATSEIMGLAYATDRLLANAATVERVFGDAFASEFAFKVTDEIIRGDGGAQCLGILSAACTVSQAKETGQAASTVVTANLSKMWTHMPARSKARAVWLVNGELGPQLDQLSIPAGTGALEPRIVTYSESGVLRIKGRPVIEIEQCEALGTVGDIILADFGEYILSPQGSIDAQSSMHVRFIYGEMTFRWTYYINGRPAWLSSVTPYKGSATVGPFVTLATRS